ncbi:MAG: hypothetical protein Kow0062_12610 [Acidobacteriota bacterium]
MTGGPHILTVNVEEFFHSGALEGTLAPKHWDRLEPTLGRSIDACLELFDRHGARATFFVFGMTAERCPETIARIAGAGHEVASRGYRPRGLRGQDEAAFADDLARARAAIEAATGQRVVGYRSSPWVDPRGLWIHDVLAAHGYRYDASINPAYRGFRRYPTRATCHEIATRHGPLAIVPVSTVRVAGRRIAFSGGTWLRQLPEWFVRRAFERWLASHAEPLVLYVLSWELLEDKPRLPTGSLYDRIRLYRHADRTRERLVPLLERFELVPVRERLGLAPEPAAAPESARTDARTHDAARPVPAGPSPAATPVSLVIPLHNERATLGYLERTLAGLIEHVRDRYRLHLLLVDDGSRDGTWDELRERFGRWPDVTLLRHETNRGVAQAILTGIRSAPTEIVCSIDADCSYDPYLLPRMIESLGDAHLLTASPYHPEGAALNVPRWRLLLSRTLSRLYSLCCGLRIATWTSCCRVYRRSAFERFALRRGDFLGIAEMLVETALAGGTVREIPATLESRLLGRSKMRTLRMILAHLAYLGELVRRRLGGRGPDRRALASLGGAPGDGR